MDWTNNGLNLYDPEGDNFTIFKNNPADKTSLNSNYVCSIAEDKTGNLWILTEGNCLNKWFPGTHSFIRYQFVDTKNGLWARPSKMISLLSLIHISEPTRQAEISYAVFCLKK